MTTQTVGTPLSRALKKRLESTKRSFYFLTRSPLATIGLAVVIAYVLIAIVGPEIIGGNPLMMKQYYLFQGHSIVFNPLPPFKYSQFPLGTTFGGYSIYEGIVKGARNDLILASAVVISGALIGVVLGSIAGYKGGVLGEAIMRVTDIFLSLPTIVIALAFLTVLGRYENVMIGALIIIWWPTYTRVVRGQVLTVREQKYVEASVAAGSSSLRTVIKHIIPNSIYPIFVQMSLDYGNVILTLAALFFLGFTFAGPGFAEWGNIISAASNSAYAGAALYNYPWTITIPGLVILLFVLSLNLFGDGLRDVLDPRMRR
ncbi:MAG: ABC transporter permease [Candidatus Thermoplasmatota archaeon]|jgi:peptide/nickel transport system permease protein|nr:ABC transporter permease [Candidatus Thermoplasmatota archaeon]